MLAVYYGSWSLTRIAPQGFLRLGGRLWEVVVYERWIDCSMLYENS